MEKEYTRGSAVDSKRRQFNFDKALLEKRDERKVPYTSSGNSIY